MSAFIDAYWKTICVLNESMEGRWRDAKRLSPFPKIEIRRRVVELGERFQHMDLDGVSTTPNHFLGDYPSFKWRRFSRAIPLDLRGKTVLDVGCNAGFYSIEMKRRGADRVVGIDSDPAYLAQARSPPR